MTPGESRLRERLSTMLPKMPRVYLGNDEEIEELLEVAKEAFVRGFKIALNVPLEMYPEVLADEPYVTRGFSLEGAAMAATLLDELQRAPRCYLHALLTNKQGAEAVLCAVGVGWAGARLRKPCSWMPPEIDASLMGAVVDGYGFHQGFFHTQRFMKRGFSERMGEWGDRGLGRALWFHHAGNVALIRDVVDNMLPYRRQALWTGVGTACAFTGGTKKRAVLLLDAAGIYNRHVQAGLEAGADLRNELARTNREKVL